MTLPPRRPIKRTDNASIHRKWLRGFVCICENDDGNCDLFHPIELAHYRTAANSGMGKKPSSIWLVPLCRVHHREQHTIGQLSFEQKHKFDMGKKALEFARQSPDRAIKESAKVYKP